VFVYIFSLKVAALLSNCIVVEQQAVLFCQKALKHLEFIGECLHNMGNIAWHRKMYTNRWVDIFKVGRTTLDDEEWSGQPSTSQMTTVLKWMHWLKKTASDYHVFGTIKEALHGRRYASDYEVQDMVHVWLLSQPKTSFSDGIKRIVNCCKICAEKEWLYWEITNFVFVTLLYMK